MQGLIYTTSKSRRIGSIVLNFWDFNKKDKKRYLSPALILRKSDLGPSLELRFWRFGLDIERRVIE